VKLWRRYSGPLTAWDMSQNRSLSQGFVCQGRSLPACRGIAERRTDATRGSDQPLNTFGYQWFRGRSQRQMYSRRKVVLLQTVTATVT
jgi:hypothetical protein